MSSPQVKEIKSFGMPDIEEHNKAAKAKRVLLGALPIALENTATGVRSIVPTNQAITGASALVSLVAGKTYRVISTVDCYIAIGNSPTLTATLSDIFLPAKEAMVISAIEGVTKLAVIGTSGSLQVMEMAL